jgi:hypothetical protein
VEVVVAAISAAIALAALIISVVVARRQTAIQARVAAIEEARRAEEVEARGRARVRAELDLGWEVLSLTNEGPAAARGVTVEVTPVGDGEAPRIDLVPLPVDLRPGQRMRFHAALAPTDRRARMTRVTVGWTDDMGANEESYVLQAD